MTELHEREVLEMALTGYEFKRAAIETEIERVRLLLRLSESEETFRHELAEHRENRGGHRHLSPEGRARIVAATKRRWARVRREKRKGGRG